MSNPDENRFKLICKLSDLPNGRGKRFLVSDIEVAVFKMDEDIHALCNVCPHQHFNLIYDGIVEDGCVVCPIHGWRFNLQTGKNPDGGRGLEIYPIKVVDENVYIKVPETKRLW